MTSHHDIIAWLVPTALHSWADKATQLPENASRIISYTPSYAHLCSRLSNLTHNIPGRAIQLSFSQPPKRPGSFIIGTDPRTCDIVLPRVEGISKQHCALTFDAHSRLVLSDFSERGTQVWYDWESNGDRTDYSWLLSSACSSEFPSMVQRITVDIQGVRFQVVVNDHSADWDAFRERVDRFCEQPCWEDESSWVDASTVLSSTVTPFQPVVVRDTTREPYGEVYLWNLARPWEPMVKASA
ncbi:hypothetical protein BBK36DRAFT_1112738 [Trichoderma citrinoviride]|uniref:FHA domain-containing protein n=1 Tax=Trichoderma citrinoviride TaxID=58853 RepID=A0A2T4BGM4_9HYPO|nr:hypothetical protein BBK36DRAFT_1112738 [Trichoderma citrinoviride]PTB68473.1 hypothetical protein BBK36DRAFT_1112738 [Trichoderma citrinoviride]